MFKWFARHKVTAVFAVLVLTFALWFLGSMLVWNVQVHFERERFVNARRDLFSLTAHIPSQNINRFSDCSYTDDGSICATKHLGCETGAEVVYPGISKEQTEDLTNVVRKTLIRGGIQLEDNKGARVPGDLLAERFNNHKLACILTSTYYDGSVPAYSRDDAVPSKGEASLIVVSCSGKAKAEYFPVTNN